MPVPNPHRVDISGGLEKAKFILQILTNVADGSFNAPGLKTAAAVALQIVDIALAAQANKEGAIAIAERTSDLMMVLVMSMKDKSEADVDAQLRGVLHAFGKDLEEIRNVVFKVVHVHANPQMRKIIRILKYLQHSKEIISCKEKLEHCFKVFQVQMHITTQLRLQGIESRLGTIDIHDPQIYRELKEIPPEAIDLLGYKGNFEDVQTAQYDGQVVVVKRYKDKHSWEVDAKTWSRNWEPFHLQLLGRSTNTTSPLYLVLRDPGQPVQHYVREQCRAGPRDAALSLLTVIKHLSHAAKALSRTEQGGCKIDTADVHIRPDGLPVLVNFDPSRFYSGTTPVSQQLWDAFARLSTESLTGSPSKPNFVVGKYARTGLLATRMSRLFIHFLWDFRFTQRLPEDEDGNTSLTRLFNKFLSVLERIEDDIKEDPGIGNSDNPLLLAVLQQFQSSLNGIWDVWEPVSVSPGDIGILRGDVERPIFEKFINVGGFIADSTTSRRDLIHHPSQVWSTDTLDGTIRHTLCLRNLDTQTKDFAFFRGRELLALGKQWDYSAAWAYVLKNRYIFETLAREHSVSVSDMCLVFSSVKNQGYTILAIDKADTLEKREEILQGVGFKDGLMYYFENLSAEKGCMQGYWSISPEPGQLLWPPTLDSAGHGWGWEHHDNHFHVEVSRKGPVQHIRYLSL